MADKQHNRISISSTLVAGWIVLCLLSATQLLFASETYARSSVTRSRLSARHTGCSRIDDHDHELDRAAHDRYHKGHSQHHSDTAYLPAALSHDPALVTVTLEPGRPVALTSVFSHADPIRGPPSL